MLKYFLQITGCILVKNRKKWYLLYKNSSKTLYLHNKIYFYNNLS